MEMSDRDEHNNNNSDTSTTTVTDHPFERSETNSVIEVIETHSDRRSLRRCFPEDVLILAPGTHMTSTTTEEVNLEQPNSSLHPIPHLINSNSNVCGMGFVGSESFCSGNLLMERMETPAITSPPILRALHHEDNLVMATRTITINLSESPTPSIMQRPPLMQRFLGIFTNTANFCLCSTFSRDCAILLLMYIGFTVLIFLLTVVSYNFLRVNIIGRHSGNSSEHYCPYHSRCHSH